MGVTSHVAGTYVIRCVPGDLGEWSAYVLESALLEVVPGPPVSLSIGLHPPKSYFATYELIQLVIQPRDAFDNHVPDAPVSPVEVGPGDVQHHMPEPTAILFMEDGTWMVTARLAEDPEGSDTVEIPIDGSPPSVTVTHPLRGATIVSSASSTVMATGAKAKDAGIVVIDPTKIEELGGTRQKARNLAKKHDFFLSEIPHMGPIGRFLGVVLGPRGKMPRPVPPVADPGAIAAGLKDVAIVRSRDKITFHTVVGTRDQGAEALTENGMEVWKRVTGRLERGSGNIRSFYVKTSMGPAIRVEVIL